MSKTEISKIVIKVGEKEFELSLKEAHELRNILNDTFPDEEIQLIQTTIPVPIYIKSPDRPYRPFEIWCCSISGNTLCLSTSDS